MWRVLRSIYDSVESSVLLEGKCTRFFNIDVGLRQGCILSPILFAIYINGLAEEITRQDLGAKLSLDKDGRLFADDIALISEDRKKLENLMEITFQYSQRWRFNFNYDKCAVVVFDNSSVNEIKLGTCTVDCTCGHHWRLGKKLIKEEARSKYLGIELDKKLSFREFKKRVGEKARKNVSRIWGMGMASGNLSVRASINLYETLVRSILEYGAEIWGDEEWDEGEKIQREIGRRILRCHGKTANEAVLGELGWWSLRTRREFMKLNIGLFDRRVKTS